MDETRTYLRKAFLRWEVMRVAYSLALPVVILRVLQVPPGTHLEPVEWLALVIFPLLVFNILHCLGPLAECLLCVFFDLRLGRFRYIVSAASLLGPVLVFHYFWPTFAFLLLPIVSRLR